MVDIKNSVGRGGKNAQADMTTIQHLINTNIGAIDPMSPLKHDGKCGTRSGLCRRRSSPIRRGCASPRARKARASLPGWPTTTRESSNTSRRSRTWPTSST